MRAARHEHDDTTPDRGHPSPGQLAAFGLGRLGRDACKTIERHVEDCPQCCQALEGVPPDNFVSRLRTAPHCSTDRTTAEASSDWPTAEPWPGTPPALVDHPRYEVQAVVGVGGMGVVYRARHRMMNRPVALKVIHERLVGSPRAVERFQREVRAAAALSHPNIVAAYDADQAGDVHFLVMEYVEGQTLAERVERHGPLPVSSASEYVRQTALALQHAFEHGFVHRDLKPQNLMLTPSGQVKVLDFGLAGLAREAIQPLNLSPPEASEAPTLDRALTGDGVVLGTPAYLAPEQAQDPRQADVRSDIYALGCTLYFLLTGKPPFTGDSHLQVIYAHAREEPPLQALGRRAPPRLRQVMQRMLAKAPADRYQTPVEVARALAPFARPASRWLLSAATAAALLLAAGLVALFWPPGGSVTTALVPLAGDTEVFSSDGKGTLTVSVSADGKRLLAGDVDGGLRLFDLEGRKQLLHLDAAAREGACAVLSPDGRYAAAWAPPEPEDGKIYLWDLTSQRQLARWEAHPGGVGQVVFLPDGRHLLSGGRDGAVRLWEVHADGSVPTQRRELRGHVGWVWCVAVSADGHFAASGGDDYVVRLWDLSASGDAVILAGHSGDVRCLAFVPDGTGLLSGGTDTTVRVWDVKSAQERLRLEGHNYVVETLSIAPDGKRVLTGDGPEKCQGRWRRGGDHGVRLWDLATGRQLVRFGGISGEVGQVAFALGGRVAVSASEMSRDLQFRRVPDDIPPPSEAPGQVRRFEAEGVSILAVAISPDERSLVGAATDNSLWLWDLESGRELRALIGHADAPQCAAFCADGSKIASGGKDGTVHVWKAATGEVIEVIRGHERAVWAVAFAGKEHVVSASADGHVRLWDMHSVRKHDLAGHEGPVWSVVVTPDGQTAYSGGQDRTVRVWDLVKGKERACWRDLPAPVRALALAPGGAGLLVGAGQEVRLLATNDGRALQQFTLTPASLGPGRGARVMADALAFLPDGRHAISAGDEDNALRIWDLQTGAQAHAFAVNNAPRGVAVTADGKFAACGGLAGCAYLWRLPSWPAAAP